MTRLLSLALPGSFARRALSHLVAAPSKVIRSQKPSRQPAFKRWFSLPVAAAAALAIAAGPATAQQTVGETQTLDRQSTAPQMKLFEDSDYFGFDLETITDVSLQRCQAICIKNAACKAITYNRSAQFCFLKSDFGKRNPFPGAVAGHRIAPKKAAGLPKPPKLDFLTPQMRASSSQLRKSISTSIELDTSPGRNQLIRQGNDAWRKRDYQGAAARFSAALKITPDDASLWIALSRSARFNRKGNFRQRRTMRDMALSAAHNAYLSAKTVDRRATALAEIARSLILVNRPRTALKAYEASLAVKDDEKERKRFETLRRRYEFRIVNNTVDSDNLNPRICVQFSENLNPDQPDMINFVRLDGKEPDSVEIKNRQICLSGVRHGRQYKVDIRSGLPSAKGEKLRQGANLNLYIRDRSPSVRFTGSNFILPATARRGIPLVSVNASKADLEIHRIGERSLTRLLSQGQFLNQLNRFQLERISDQLGVPVWKGTVDIKPELNREVVTSIALDTALPKREPGVYVMLARPTDRNPQNNSRATQWFVISDIGLTTFAGQDGLRVISRSLDTAKPLSGVKLSLIAQNNEVLGTATTDDQGMARFDAGLMRGKRGLVPATLTAQNGSDDFVFLNMTNPGFDFSDRGVTGRPSAAAVDVLAWTERGIYRAGETVHASALARDSKANALDDLPLTFIFTRPDGVEERRIVSKGETLGGHSLALALPPNAKRGTWNLSVHTDPKAPALASQRFLVEDFLPEKTDLTLTPAAKQIARGRALSVAAEGRYLYGAPAAGLKLNGRVIVRSGRTRSDAPGYLFGLADEGASAVQRFGVGAIAPLDAEGKGTISVMLDKLKASTRPLKAELVVSMQEGNGRAIERRTRFEIAARQAMIGIRPDFKGARVAEGGTAGFSLIAVAPDGTRTNLSGVRWSLVKVERNYQWYRENGRWRYEAINSESKIADGTVELQADTEANVAIPVEWGRYRLDLESTNAEGPASSYTFSAGWYVEQRSTETPDGLEIALDKESYKPGEIAKLKISPRFAGELLLAIGTDSILETRSVTIPKQGATLDIPVSADWGAGAYVLATLHRPGGSVTSRAPSRAIGTQWISVDPLDRKLSVELNTADQVRPNAPFTVPVTIKNLKPGAEAYVTIAAVDVGILNLTRHKIPEPDGWYFGQRRLGLAMRDIYGKLIDGSLGASGRLRTGGDGGIAGMSTNGSAPTQKLLAFHSGPIRVGDDGTAEVTFDLPPFNGTARVTATAWSADAVGSAQKETVIRAPVVVAASVPKFLAPGDEARALIEITNTDAPEGVYDLSVTSNGKVTHRSGTVPGSLDLARDQKVALSIPITAAAIGTGEMVATLTGADGSTIEKSFTIPVRAGALPVTRKVEATLAANGGSLLIDGNLLDGSLLDGAKVNIAVARPSAFDPASILIRLDNYPFYCAEQTTSKAMPLLYASDFPGGIPGMDRKAVDDRIRNAIDRVLAYQSSSGGFSLWGSGADDLWLGAYVADFLTRAREKGHVVPQLAFKRVLDSLQNTLSFKKNLDQNEASIAYALYVLARNRRASVGDLRYYSDTQLSKFLSPMSRAHLAAGMALYGDTERSAKVFAAAYDLAAGNPDSRRVRGNDPYGSPLRDTTALLALATEVGATGQAASLVPLVESLIENDRYTSTQEQAWMLLAARAEKEANKSNRLEVDGRAHQGAFAQQVNGESLTVNPIRVANRGPEPLRASVTTVAVPSEPLPPGGRGFTIKREIYRLDGKPANTGVAEQNERFVVVLKVQQQEDVSSRLIVTDLLPAGFEIDNPRIVRSADLSAFKWLPQRQPAHTDFRDDRFIAAFNRNKGGKKDFTVAYIVRAVTPGTYLHPAAQVEDMYRPELSARTSTTVLQVFQK